ncbi:Fur-regulated basic protein FbpA [Anoxybacillus sp. B7M1]|uniref:Fur-regulated basic protein FbpA n=1 Tax=Anoxybacillus sp. B7M1 TaxID=1490057 RepID=UPI0005CDBE3F|nr:Fur-regulated basic protein FbpA [Anoxybacillus sp. B7M1]
MILRKAVEKAKKRKDRIIDFLIRNDVYESPDGRQLYELSLYEINEMYQKIKKEREKNNES